MNQFQVPTHGIPVQIFMDGEGGIRGHLFAASDRYHQGASAEVEVLLNDERCFLPFLMDGGEDGSHSVVLNKEHILRVRLENPESGTRAGSTEETDSAVLHLSDGSSLEGQVLVETPPAAARLVDKVNHAPRFIPVARAGGIDFVQRTHVRRLD